jgi:hypothetical protein
VGFNPAPWQIRGRCGWSCGHSRAPFGCGFAALRCIAELHYAGRWEIPMRGTIRRHAEYNSAIQQIENLRYVSEPTAIPAAEARMSRAILGQQMPIGG